VLAYQRRSNRLGKAIGLRPITGLIRSWTGLWIKSLDGQTALSAFYALSQRCWRGVWRYCTNSRTPLNQGLLFSRRMRVLRKNRLFLAKLLGKSGATCAALKQFQQSASAGANSSESGENEYAENVRVYEISDVIRTLRFKIMGSFDSIVCWNSVISLLGKVLMQLRYA
jgi:hypothetical protein